MLRIFAQYAGARMLFLGLFFLMVTRTSFVPLFKSNYPVTISSMISFMEKVGKPVLLWMH